MLYFPTRQLTLIYLHEVEESRSGHLVSGPDSEDRAGFKTLNLVVSDLLTQEFRRAHETCTVHIVMSGVGHGINKKLPVQMRDNRWFRKETKYTEISATNMFQHSWFSWYISYFYIIYLIYIFAHLLVLGLHKYKIQLVNLMFGFLQVAKGGLSRILFCH